MSGKIGKGGRIVVMQQLRTWPQNPFSGLCDRTPIDQKHDQSARRDPGSRNRCRSSSGKRNGLPSRASVTFPDTGAWLCGWRLESKKTRLLISQGSRV